MTIRIHKITNSDSKYSICPTEELTPDVIAFLNNDGGYSLSSIVHRATGHSVGSGFNLENQHMKYSGYMECTIDKGDINQLIDKLLEKFNLRVLTSSEENWTLANPHEIDEW